MLVREVGHPIKRADMSTKNAVGNEGGPPHFPHRRRLVAAQRPKVDETKVRLFWPRDQEIDRRQNLRTHSFRFALTGMNGRQVLKTPIQASNGRFVGASRQVSG
jgi:hypothetical protein